MAVIDEIAAERRRQIEEEGWTPAHDDTHTDGSLALAAAYYASPVEIRCKWPVPCNCREAMCPHVPFGTGKFTWARAWPWPEEPKKKDHRRNLVRSAALAIAEIERLDRADQKTGDPA